jgi:hypothetical protein
MTNNFSRWFIARSATCLNHDLPNHDYSHLISVRLRPRVAPLDQGPIGRGRETCENSPSLDKKNKKKPRETTFDPDEHIEVKSDYDANDENPVPDSLPF